MANEIFTSLELTARKNGATISARVSGDQDMAGDDLLQLTQVIGTTAEAVSFGEITGAPAQVMIQNLDATNFVEIGGDSGLTVFKLKILAGKAVLISPSSGTMYAKADTAAVRILVVAVEA
jgi:hypothetical protein